MADGNDGIRMKLSLDESLLQDLEPYRKRIAAEGALVIQGRALLVYLAVLAVLSGAAFGAGLAWGKRDMDHLRTVNEIAAAQNRHGAYIDQLCALQAGIDTQVANHADSLAALWRCYTSLAGRK